MIGDFGSNNSMENKPSSLRVLGIKAAVNVSAKKRVSFSKDYIPDEWTPLLKSSINKSSVIELHRPSVALAPVRATPAHQSRSLKDDLLSNEGYYGTNFSKRQLFALLSMLLLYFADFALLSILEPFFPLEAEAKGLSPAMNGLIFSVYSFVIVVMSPVYSKVIPIVNPRTLYLVGISLNVLSYIFFGMIHFINEKSIFIVVSLGLRVFGALGAACYLTVIYAVLPELFPKCMNTINGFLEAAMGFGMCVGPVIGLGLYSAGGFSLPFFVLGSIMIFTIPICWFTFPRDIQPSIQDTPKGVINVLSRPGVVLSYLVLACVSFSESMLFPVFQPYLDDLGLSIDLISLIYVLLNATYSIASILVGYAVDQLKSPESFMIAGLSIMSISLLFLGHSPILPNISKGMIIYQDIIAVVLLGLSCALCVIPTFATMLKHTKEEGETLDLGTTAICSGLWSASYAIGEMIGPLYSGLMFEIFSFGTLTTFAALVPLILMIILLIFQFVRCSRILKARARIFLATPYKSI